MKHNEHYDVDALIKNIYQAYIDIKSKEFGEIQKDMLLDNIKLLYSKVKEIETTTSFITQKQDLNELSSIQNPIEFSTEKIEEEEVVEEVELPQDFESNPIEESSIASKNDPHEIEEENSRSPILEDTNSTIESIVTGEESIENSLESTHVHESPQVLSNDIEEDLSVLPPMKTVLSSSNITDYLKSDPTIKRDIFDYIDINTRIGLVEIFFKGNSIELTEALSLINKTEDKKECINIMNMYANKNGIVEKDDIYLTFLQLIERKFQNLR